ncbi:MAG: Gfo/Idh/MocA family oxidoreductase [Planctomycetes bacterium]|nr:Gfo/Idh/MocA family oxidoreductase [Planctomycetota bacterium]
MNSASEASGSSAGSERRLRAAVVGAGHLGRIHSRVYREIGGVDLVGVVDAREDRARGVAERLGSKGYKAVGELPSDLDVVSIATPTVAHAEIAIPFLERGVSVLVEKPIAASIEEADAMLAAASRSGAVLTVGHSERFNPGIRAVAEFAVRPRFVEVHRLAPFSFRSQDVGVVLDLMIHDLDLLLHLVCDEVESVDAVGGNVLTTAEDLANARIRFKNGCVANVTASRVSLEPLRRMRFFSPDSYVSLDLQKRYALAVRKGPRWESERKRLSELDPASLQDPRAFVFGGLLEIKEAHFQDETEPLKAEIAAFLNAVRGAGQNPCSGDEGRRALALAVRVLQSMDANAWRL